MIHAGIPRGGGGSPNGKLFEFLGNLRGVLPGVGVS